MTDFSPMPLKEKLAGRAGRLQEALSALQADSFVRDFDAIVATMVEAFRDGKLVMMAGNGGSAADAQGFSTELLGKLNRDRTPLRSIALTVDTSLLTAIGNDYGYNHCFARQIEGLAKPGDVFIGITTSGNSENIIEAFKMCKQKDVHTVLLSGKSGGKALAHSDIALVVPSDVTAVIQEAHVFVYHTVCEMVEETLVAEGICAYRDI